MTKASLSYFFFTCFIFKLKKETFAKNKKQNKTKVGRDEEEPSQPSNMEEEHVNYFVFFVYFYFNKCVL